MKMPPLTVLLESPYLVNFTNKLESITKATGMEKDLYLFNVTLDKWVQDFVEPGYASMPGPNGTTSIQTIVLCSRKWRDSALLIFLSFQKAGVGAVQHLGVWSPKTNARGNLEAIPPYALNGKAWPAGRRIVGKHDSERRRILPYLEAQESQKPLRLDT